jgi:hypothetical protein
MSVYIGVYRRISVYIGVYRCISVHVDAVYIDTGSDSPPSSPLIPRSPRLSETPLGASSNLLESSRNFSKRKPPRAVNTPLPHSEAPRALGPLSEAPRTRGWRTAAGTCAPPAPPAASPPRPGTPSGRAPAPAAAAVVCARLAHRTPLIQEGSCVRARVRACVRACVRRGKDAVAYTRPAHRVSGTLTHPTRWREE